MIQRPRHPSLKSDIRYLIWFITIGTVPASMQLNWFTVTPKHQKLQRPRHPSLISDIRYLIWFITIGTVPA